jgi:V/A-type H+-transporting ATPase subunit C
VTGSDYANARIRAMKGRLLGPARTLEVLAQPDLAARLEYLGRTDYAEALAAHAGRGLDPLSGAERGLRARLVDDRLRIDRHLGPGRARELLRSVLALEDGWNLKTVLRGVAGGERPERLFPLLAPTPELDDPALAELVGQKDVKAVVDLLATWRSPYFPPLLEALPAYAVHRELFLLEAALDRFLFARALAAARRDGLDGRILRVFLEDQIDLANAATLLKLGEGARSGEYFIPGGRVLSAKLFRKLAGLAGPALRQALAGPALLRLGALLRLPGGRPEPIAVDQILHQTLRERLRREARVHPLSLAVPLSYLLERQAEVRRLRLVLRGAEFGLPAGELLSLLER